jgi:hypothetical protein
MAVYGVENRAMEHRCQCCGEPAGGVFCDDCLAHMHAEVESPAENRLAGGLTGRG